MGDVEVTATAELRVGLSPARVREIHARLAEIKASSEAGSADWLDPVSDARWLLDEVDRLRGALYECAAAAGEDTSDGAPTWPDLADWAVEAVQQLRRDYDDDDA